MDIRPIKTKSDYHEAFKERAAQIEAARKLPDDLLAAGCFRIFVPRIHGRLEIDLPSGLEIFEALARANRSTGWIMIIGAEGVMLLALLPRHRF
jgi:indole-3-acetate monooxygenase